MGYYFRSLEARNLIPRIRANREGGFFSHVGAKPNSIDGCWEPLAHNTLRNIVLNCAARAGLNVGRNEKGGDAETERLGAHFLRGHSASVAYTLKSLEEAAWSESLHLDRARHSQHTFEKSYSRGVHPQIREAFKNHPNKAKLRVEEALIL